VFKVVFTQAARLQLVQAEDWYESEVAGLGRRFREAIDTVAKRISINARQFPVVFKSIRRALLRVVSPTRYCSLLKTILFFVIACFHASRAPAQWQRRT
jgi:toxin ParE1/3/4